MVKQYLIVGALLGAGFFAAGAGAVLGVALGTRALVVSATAVKPAPIVTIALNGHPGGSPVVMAMGDAAATAE
jgi:hypothetical protein